MFFFFCYRSYAVNMKLFLSILLLAAIKDVRSTNSNPGDGDTSKLNNGNNDYNRISNNTITHHTLFDTKLNHLVVDRNTGRVSNS